MHIDYNQYFKYDYTSPSLISRLERTKAPNSKLNHVGTLNKRLGYWQVRQCNILHYVHRIVYCLTHKVSLLNGASIDHLDGNTLNNNPDNLRLVTHKTNLQNSKMLVSNTSGIKGVCFFKKRGYGRWCAQWIDNRFPQPRRGKEFACSVYGFEGAKQLAINYRAEMIRELNADGMQYTTRHLGLP